MSCPICKFKITYYFAKKDGYLYNRCPYCKTVFLHSFPSSEYLREYYSQQISYSNGLQNETAIRKRGRVILKKLGCLAPKVKTLCDVGSSYGFFLDEAQKNGYEPIGIEPAKRFADYAKRDYHVFTFVGELKDYRKQKQFDIVTCIHVIEHVMNPKEFVSSLLKLVKPGGILYVETPNSDSHLLYAEKGQYTFLLPPDHLWLFSKKSMRYLFPKNAESIYINTYSYSEHFMGVMKALVSKYLHRTKNVSSFRKFDINNPIDIKSGVKGQMNNVRKRFFYYLFDKTLAPLFTSLLNLYHKGSILELYVRKKIDKSGL